MEITKFRLKIAHYPIDIVLGIVYFEYKHKKGGK